MTEKRKRTRARAGFQIHVDLGGKTVKAQTINVSLTGLLCSSSPHFRKDAPCLIIFTLDPGTKVNISGKILRSGPGEAAIAFTSMDEESFSHLKKLVSYNTGNADIIEKELAEPGFAMK